MIYTKNKRPDKNPEIHTGVSLVERAGYVSAKTRIENMMLAGQRLVDYRKSRYDFGPEDQIDYDFDDPTRKRGLDLAEASEMQRAAEGRIRSSQKRAEALPGGEKRKGEVDNTPPEKGAE